MAEDGGTAQIEIRASWTPTDSPDDLGAHVEAWGELMCTAAGLAPGARRRDRDAEPPRPAGLRRGAPDPMPDRWTSPTTTTPRGGRSTAGTAAAAARPAAAAGRHRRGARHGLRGGRRRHRPGRDRRRARVGLPLLLPRLPGPAAPRGLRHPPGRPDRLRVDGAAARGARRHGVDPPRRHPGPAVPHELGLRPDRAVRHRARRAAPRLPAGRPGRAGRSSSSASGWPRSTPRSTGRPGRSPHPGWSTPRSTWSCSSSCATLLVDRARGGGQDGWAAEEFDALRDFRRRRGSRRGVVRRASTGSAAAASLGAVRALWEARDEIAQERDVTPGRILPDAAIVAAATALPTHRRALLQTKGFHGRGAERYAPRWVEALREVVRAARGRAAVPRAEG